MPAVVRWTMIKSVALSAALACFAAGTMLADFSYEQTSKITGGAMMGMMRMAGAFSKQAREPIVASILVSGNRMAHISRHTAQITDVDKETITEINFDKKTYSVMTFAQMKQAMEDMAQRAQQGKPGDAANVQFKAAVNDTGQSKPVAGMPAKEVIITLTMEGTDAKTGQTGSMDIVSDMWIARVPGSEEVRRLQKRMAEKLGMMPGENFSALFAQKPEMAKGMADLYKEMAKVGGMPVEMVTKMGGSGGDGGASTNSSSGGQQQAPRPSASDTATGSALGRLGLGGFGRKKKNTDQDQQQTASQPDASQNGSGTLMEMTTDLSGFSSAPVDQSKFEVPAGFKQVDAELNRRGR